LERTRISPSVDSTVTMIVQACVKCCTCCSTQRNVSCTIQLNSVPTCLCELVAIGIILEALQRSYSEPPLVSLRQHQYNFISVHIIVRLSDLLSMELSVVAFCQLLALCSYQKEIWTFVYRDVARGGAVGWGTGLQAGSIPDGVTGIFHWHILSGRTMALGLTRPLTEMSPRNIPLGGYRRTMRGAAHLTPFMCRFSW
jgi:hypothetical protein